MSIQVKTHISVAVIFLWIGFFCAISFMEAWLKFQAPDVTLAIGLGIGRLVFGALNKIEWIFALIVLILIVGKETRFKWENLLFLIVLAILIIQTSLLLPALDARAESLINGHNVPASNLHFYYVGMEVVKALCLVIFGVKQSGILKASSNKL